MAELSLSRLAELWRKRYIFFLPEQHGWPVSAPYIGSSRLCVMLVEPCWIVLLVKQFDRVAVIMFDSGLSSRLAIKSDSYHIGFRRELGSRLLLMEKVYSTMIENEIKI